MNMSFREKSTWISLVTTLFIFGYYFTEAFPALSDGDADSMKIFGLFIGVIIGVVVLQVLLHGALAIAFRKEAEKGDDERDKLFELRATRNAYFLLVLGVCATGAGMLLTSSPFVMANIILFFFVLSEIAGFITQLFYHRRRF